MPDVLRIRLCGRRLAWRVWFSHPSRNCFSTTHEEGRRWIQPNMVAGLRFRLGGCASNGKRSVDGRFKRRALRCDIRGPLGPVFFDWAVVFRVSSLQPSSAPSRFDAMRAGGSRAATHGTRRLSGLCRRSPNWFVPAERPVMLVNNRPSVPVQRRRPSYCSGAAKSITTSRKDKSMAEYNISSGMKVVQFQRRPLAGNHSIERVFETVRSGLAGVEIAVNICPFESQGFFRRLYNSVDEALSQGDVNHVTGDVHYLAPLLRKNRTVLTVHDCGTMLRICGLRRLVYLWMWLELPLRRCSIVTVISEQTKRELLQYTSCPEYKIRVVPDPVSDEFRPAPKAFNADRPRILHIGSTVNKNLDRLTAALSGIPCKLDIIGRISVDAKKRLDDAGVEYECAAGLSSRSEEHTSELQSLRHLVCRLL